MKIRKPLLLLTAMLGASAMLPAHAATITQCETISRPEGYLTVEMGISKSSCPTGKAIKYQTPFSGLHILKPFELDGMSPPFAVSMYVGTFPNIQYQIKNVFDGGTYCALRPIPFNYYSLPNGLVSGCGAGPNNSVKMKLVHTSTLVVPSSGNRARVRVALRTDMPDYAYVNYAIRTTATLNGVSTTVNKTGLTGSRSYGLNELAPSLRSHALQGASFSFSIDVFSSTTYRARSTLAATGAQMAY